MLIMKLLKKDRINSFIFIIIISIIIIFSESLFAFNRTKLSNPFPPCDEDQDIRCKSFGDLDIDNNGIKDLKWSSKFSCHSSNWNNYSGIKCTGDINTKKEIEFCGVKQLLDNLIVLRNTNQSRYNIEAKTLLRLFNNINNSEPVIYVRPTHHEDYCYNGEKIAHNTKIRIDSFNSLIPINFYGGDDVTGYTEEANSTFELEILITLEK